MPKLHNPRWELFVQRIALHGDTNYDAWLSTGARGNKRNLKRHAEIIRARPEVQARLEELQEELKERRVEAQLITASEIIQGVMHNARLGQAGHDRMGKIGHPKEGNEQFIPTGEKIFDLRASNQAYELLARQLGLPMGERHQQLKVGKLDPLEGLDMMETLRLVQRAFLESLNVEIDLDLIRVMLTGDGAQASEALARAQLPEARALPALSETS